MLYNKKAQAATELAVLGSLIIVAFSFLIQYSEKINRQQSNIQQTFRAALGEARGANSSASYTKVAFRRMPNVSNPMELGQQQNFSSSSNVLWSDCKVAADPVIMYKLNEDEAITIPYSDTPEEGTTTTTNTFTSTVFAITNFDKTEDAGGIVTTKSLEAADFLDANVTIDGTVHPFMHSLGERPYTAPDGTIHMRGGKYYPGVNNLLRERPMQ